jgi:signal transduction histidine kinase
MIRKRRPNELSATELAARATLHDVGNNVTVAALHASSLLSAAMSDGARPLAAVRAPLQQVVSALDRVVSLVNGFKNSCPEHRQKRAIDIAPMLRDVIDAWRPHAHARAIELRLELRSDVLPTRGDAEDLRRVFDNLVKNALEAVDNGPGSVTVVAEDRNHQIIHLSVRDTGPGMEHDLNRPGPFPSTKPEGTGLGLSIVHEIVHAHEGRLYAEPLIPSGTAVNVELERAH